MDTSIELDFADGRYRFWLAMPQILAIEKGERSIMEIWADFGSAIGIHGDEAIFLGGGPARFRDIIEVIRQGLIGGANGVVNGETIKTSPIDATRIIATYVHNRPIAETLPVAWAVLQAAIFGVRLDPKKKGTPVAKARTRSAKARSSRTAASSA